MRIIFAPYAATLPNGVRNAKNYPEWGKVVAQLNALGHEIIQIGLLGEKQIEGVSQHFVNYPLNALKDVVRNSDFFLTVDSFLPHFVFAENLGKRGVVVWSQSDPLIWGHPENINLLKDRKYLRPLQFQGWVDATYNEDAFVSVDEVVNACQSLVESLKSSDRASVVSAIV